MTAACAVSSVSLLINTHVLWPKKSIISFSPALTYLTKHIPRIANNDVDIAIVAKTKTQGSLRDDFDVIQLPDLQRKEQQIFAEQKARKALTKQIVVLESKKNETNYHEINIFEQINEAVNKSEKPVPGEWKIINGPKEVRLDSFDVKPITMAQMITEKTEIYWEKLANNLIKPEAESKEETDQRAVDMQASRDEDQVQTISAATNREEAKTEEHVEDIVMIDVMNGVNNQANQRQVEESIAEKKTQLALSAVAERVVSQSQRERPSEIQARIAQTSESNYLKEPNNVPKQAKEESLVEGPGETSIKIKPFSIKENEYPKNIKNFEIHFFDENNTAYTIDTGVWVSTTKSTDEYSQRIVLSSQNHLTTRARVNYGSKGEVQNIPLLENKFFESLSPQNVSDVGSLLIELDEETIDISLSGHYVRKIYLDEKFKETTNEMATFVIFVGIVPGNKVVISKTVNGERGFFTHIAPDELTYETERFVRLEKNEIAFYQEDVLSKEKRILNISESDIEVMLRRAEIRKTNTNSVALSEHQYLKNERLYLNAKNNDGEDVVVGLGKVKNVSIPTESYIRRVVSEFDEGEKNGCVVQLNVTKPLKDISTRAESFEESHVIELKALDKDGAFYSSVSSETEKIFLSSEPQIGDTRSQSAIIHVEIKYADKSIEHLSTPCGPKQYIVEQL